MKKVIICFAILIYVGSFTAGVAGSNSDDKKDSKVERIVASDANVTVTLCVMAGQITVRGWNKNQVRATSVDAEQIELKRMDNFVDETKPARRIDVFIDDRLEESRSRADCQASADVELDVPKGATVQVQTRDGDISIVGVEGAYAGSQNGDICIEGVANKIEAGSIGGSISVKDSGGRLSLSSAGGSIEATNVKPMDGDDNFEVITVSGDIQLEKISHAKLSARSVTGNINLAGSLAQSGVYGFNTMSGDVTLSLPSEASFRLIAKLSQDGEIITDFPLTLTTEPAVPEKAPRSPGAVKAPRAAPAPSVTSPSPTAPPAQPGVEDVEQVPIPKPVTTVKVSPVVKAGPPLIVKVAPPVVAIPYSLRRVNAVCGSGDASINVSSFSGTLRLQKN
jgi:hypothetical protein